jgi:hypothetical protein
LSVCRGRSGVLEIAGVVAWWLGGVGPATMSADADDEVAEAGHGVWGVAGADLGGALGVGDVADVRGRSVRLCRLWLWGWVRDAGGGLGEGEQAGFWFGQYAAGDETFEFGAQAFGVVDGGADAECAADVFGA